MSTSVKSFIRLTRITILNYFETTRNILFIDVSASCRKPSSGLTSGAGRQYVGIFTRAEKTRAASICNKSAITDHVCNENHVIDWENAKVIDRESDKAGRHIREAI